MDAAAVAAITGGIDFATVVTGIGVVAAAISLALVAQKGARMLLSMLRGA